MAVSYCCGFVFRSLVFYRLHIVLICWLEIPSNCQFYRFSFCSFLELCGYFQPRWKPRHTERRPVCSVRILGKHAHSDSVFVPSSIPSTGAGEQNLSWRLSDSRRLIWAHLFCVSTRPCGPPAMYSWLFGCISCWVHFWHGGHLSKVSRGRHVCPPVFHGSVWQHSRRRMDGEYQAVLVSDSYSPYLLIC